MVSLLLKLLVDFVSEIDSTSASVLSVLLRILQLSFRRSEADTEVSAIGQFIEDFLSSTGEAETRGSAWGLLGEVSGVSWTRKASGLSLLSDSIPPAGLSARSPGE